MPLSRKDATAISLAALRMAGFAPPCGQRLRGRGRAPGKRSEIGRLEVERADRDEIEPLAGRRHPLRPGERIGDRHPHVGRAQLGEHRAVDIFDQAVDHRLRDGRRSRSRRRRPGTGGRPRSARGPCSSGSPNRPRSWRPSTNWDGRPPRPAVAARIRSSGQVAERAAARGEDDPADALRPGAVEALEDRHYARNRPAAASRRSPPRPRVISAPGRDQGLLVGERDGAAAFERAHHRLQAGGADDRRHRPVGAGRGGLDDRRLAPPRPRCRCRPAPSRELAEQARRRRSPPARAPKRLAASARPATSLWAVSATIS